MQTHWIGGKPFASEEAAEIPVVNPVTEEVVDTIPAGCDADVDAAIQAARAAYPEWAQMGPAQRRKYFWEIAEKVRAHQAEAARLLTIEHGKPYRQASWEIGTLIGQTLGYGELSVHVRGATHQAPKTNLVFHQRVPRGVVACIMPWNFPLSLSFEGIIPALAAGNVVVWKPSEKAPLACRWFAERVFDGLPPGVVNLVHGAGTTVGEALVRHTGVDMVIFVGSVATGRVIGRICGEQMKKCVLELGGKDALIVDETVDLPAAVKFATDGAFANSGQICSSTERIYVQRRVFDEFVDQLVEEAASLRVGDGLSEDTDLGPLVDEIQLNRVIEHVDEAIARGATVRHGGTRLNRCGYFFPPTVMTDVPADCRLMTEETFGPVAPVAPFDEFDEAIALANNATYGHGVIICTTSAPRAIKAIEEMENGMIKINARRGKAPGSSSEPAKNSGIGYGYGMEIFDEVTRKKSVHWHSIMTGPAEWF